MLTRVCSARINLHHPQGMSWQISQYIVSSSNSVSGCSKPRFVIVLSYVCLKQIILTNIACSNIIIPGETSRLSDRLMACLTGRYSHKTEPLGTHGGGLRMHVLERLILRPHI